MKLDLLTKTLFKNIIVTNWECGPNNILNILWTIIIFQSIRINRFNRNNNICLVLHCVALITYFSYIALPAYASKLFIKLLAFIILFIIQIIVSGLCVLYWFYSFKISFNTKLKIFLLSANKSVIQVAWSMVFFCVHLSNNCPIHRHQVFYLLFIIIFTLFARWIKPTCFYFSIRFVSEVNFILFISLFFVSNIYYYCV